MSHKDIEALAFTKDSKYSIRNWQEKVVLISEPHPSNLLSLWHSANEYVNKYHRTKLRKYLNLNSIFEKMVF